MSDETRPDIGETLIVRLVDGRTLDLRPTVGDLARFEEEQGVPTSARFASGFMLSATARIGWYAATRTRQYVGTYAEWLEVLGDASSLPDVERVETPERIPVDES